MKPTLNTAESRSWAVGTDTASRTCGTTSPPYRDCRIGLEVMTFIRFTTRFAQPNLKRDGP